MFARNSRTVAQLLSLLSLISLLSSCGEKADIAVLVDPYWHAFISQNRDPEKFIRRTGWLNNVNLAYFAPNNRSEAEVIKKTLEEQEKVYHIVVTPFFASIGQRMAKENPERRVVIAHLAPEVEREERENLAYVYAERKEAWKQATLTSLYTASHESLPVVAVMDSERNDFLSIQAGIEEALTSYEQGSSIDYLMIDSESSRDYVTREISKLHEESIMLISAVPHADIIFEHFFRHSPLIVAESFHQVKRLYGGDYIIVEEPVRKIISTAIKVSKREEAFGDQTVSAKIKRYQ